METWVGWRETEWSRFIRESRIEYGVYDRSQKEREESGGKRKERLWIGSYAGLPSVPLAEVEIELEWRWRGEGEGWYGVWVGCLALVGESLGGGGVRRGFWRGLDGMEERRRGSVGTSAHYISVLSTRPPHLAVH